MILSGISQMYWLTRMDAIKDFFLLTFSICAVALFVLGVISIVVTDGYLTNLKPRIRHILTSFLAVGIVNIVLYHFTPTTNETLLIYGVGTTIDYVDNNDTIKQLPDKTVKALKKYLDSLNKDEE